MPINGSSNRPIGQLTGQSAAPLRSCALLLFINVPEGVSAVCRTMSDKNKNKMFIFEPDKYRN